MKILGKARSFRRLGVAEEEKKIETTKQCFVVGPIGTEESPERIHADWLLDGIIQPVMTEYPQFKTERADQIAQPGMIDAQVINALLNADLVIADLSGSNPNAFYEIGIRHMAQKPIIHMQLADEKIPFDVSLYRAIKFSRQHPRDLKAAQSALKAQVEAVLASSYQVDNPVTRTRGVLKLQENATPAQQVIADQLQAMQAQINAVTEQNRMSTYVWLSRLRGSEFGPEEMNALRKFLHAYVEPPVKPEEKLIVELAPNSKLTDADTMIRNMGGVLGVDPIGEHSLRVTVSGVGTRGRYMLERIANLSGVKSVRPE
jgi:hypothetical protein